MERKENAYRSICMHTHTHTHTHLGIKREKKGEGIRPEIGR